MTTTEINLSHDVEELEENGITINTGEEEDTSPEYEGEDGVKVFVKECLTKAEPQTPQEEPEELIEEITDANEMKRDSDGRFMTAEKILIAEEMVKEAEALFLKMANESKAVSRLRGIHNKLNNRVQYSMSKLLDEKDEITSRRGVAKQNYHNLVNLNLGMENVLPNVVLYTQAPSPSQMAETIVRIEGRHEALMRTSIIMNLGALKQYMQYALTNSEFLFMDYPTKKVVCDYVDTQTQFHQKMQADGVPADQEYLVYPKSLRDECSKFMILAMNESAEKIAMNYSTILPSLLNIASMLDMLSKLSPIDRNIEDDKELLVQLRTMREDSSIEFFECLKSYNIRGGDITQPIDTYSIIDIIDTDLNRSEIERVLSLIVNQCDNLIKAFTAQGHVFKFPDVVQYQTEQFTRSGYGAVNLMFLRVLLQYNTTKVLQPLTEFHKDVLGEGEQRPQSETEVPPSEQVTPATENKWRLF